MIPILSPSLCINNTNDTNKIKVKFCNCKKTKCVKLYCECFSAGELCGNECKCLECFNNENKLE